MAHENRRAAMLKKHGLKGVNKPKKTPGHKTKSHVVLAASKLDPTIKKVYEERKGIELWTHILGPNEKDNGLDWHIDKVCKK